MNDPVEGDHLGDRYRLVARRASGATATVWEAHDELLDRRVAVKVLHTHLADDEVAERFANEARTAATVTHPGLVAVYDTLVGPPPAIVLEWINGGDLRARIDAGPLDADEAAALGATIADALSALHSRGLVHRDVKPANVLLMPDGRPKLADFGIATTNPGDRTATGVVLGTAKYLSPEQVRGDPIDGRTDIYSLCAVLYEALTGQPPFERDGDLPTAIARLEEAPAPLRTIRPDIPTILESVVLRGLAREPDARWPSAHELRDRLSTIGLADVARTNDARTDVTRAEVTLPATTAPEHPSDLTTAAVVAVPPAPASSPVRPSRRRRWPRVVGLVVLVAIGLLAWQLLTAGGAVRSVLDELDSADPMIVGVTAFDPEGSGPAGEYDDLAAFAIDGDADTVWHTERYDQRDLGTKSGVGLVLELAEPVRVDEVEVRTVDADRWSATVHVNDDRGDDLASFAPADATGTDLPETAVLRPGARGRYVLVWFVDLGRGDLPIRLVVADVIVR